MRELRPRGGTELCEHVGSRGAGAAGTLVF